MCEILAPAGNKSSALAAINAGADAIYLGLDKFSARSSAENFDGESFKDICKYAHAFEVKVYAALNTLIKDAELDDFSRGVESAWNDGADAIILQDIFLGKHIKNLNPNIVLHLSTQAGTCNEYGALLAKEYGFSRVILARETGIDDIRKIAKMIETEVFIQGALCTCFSGQCYMSSFAGGNSGNRGKCKQPCRKLYYIDRKGFDDRAYRISLSDLCVGEQIHDLIDAGVASFKIEGRMRRPEYVAAAVTYYKKLLSGNDNLQDELSSLKRTFNRGNYTKGLAFGQDKSFISSAVQGHIGEYVGVVKVENSKYICYTQQKFGHGDGFKILRDGKEVGGGIFGGTVKGGFTISARDRLKSGDKVFITTDTALNERLAGHKLLIPLKISAQLFSNKKAEIVINGTQYSSDYLLESAKNRPISVEDIKNCFLKADNFPFAPEFIKIDTDGIFLASSQLNALRRKVYSEYFEKISSSDNEKVELKYSLPASNKSKNKKTAAICGNLNGISADIGILKPYNYFDLEKLCNNFDGEKFLFVPPYLNSKDIGLIKTAAEGFDGIYCDGYFGFLLAKELGLRFFAGTGFNITNKISLSECKSDYIALSKELTLSEAEGLSAENAFYLTAGDIKVMDLIYCPFEKKCSDCDKRNIYNLTDESGRKFPLRRYKLSDCRFEVYNCAQLISDAQTGKLYDLTLENNTIANAVLGGNTSLKEIFKNYTRGHSNCPVL